MIRREAHTGFWWGNQRERDNLEYPGLDGKIILKYIIKEVECRVIEWIELAQDRDRWRTLVNAVMKLRVP
jgi:hypothetical protein